METGTVPTAVYVIWWTVLLVVVFVIVPIAVALLHRTLAAALSIKRYLHEMLQAGGGIAGHTASISALNETIRVAGTLVTTAGSIKEHTGTIAAVLSQRTGSRP